MSHPDLGNRKITDLEEERQFLELLLDENEAGRTHYIRDRLHELGILMTLPEAREQAPAPRRE